MGYIRKEEVLSRLALIKEECIAANKRACAGTAQDAISTVMAMRDFEYLDAKSASPETSEITVTLEPFFPGGQIVRDVYRCGFCQTQVDPHDRFCKFCGRKLITKEGKQKK